MRSICNIMLLYLEDNFFSGPSKQTFNLMMTNKAWCTIVNEQYPLFREDAYLNHMKRSFTNELMKCPDMQKYCFEK